MEYIHEILTSTVNISGVAVILLAEQFDALNALIT